MTQYRNGLHAVEAVRFTGKNRREVLAFAYPDMSKEGLDFGESESGLIVIATKEGNEPADVGNWIVKNEKGDVFPLSNEIFSATYLQPIYF